MQHIPSSPLRSKRFRAWRWQRIAVIILFIGGGVGLFTLGVGVGNGSVALGPDSVFRKSQNQQLPADLDYASVEELYDRIKSNYDGTLTLDSLLDGLKDGLASAIGDPYTEYLNADEAQSFDDDLNGTFSGIGAELTKDETGNIVIIAPISGFPAEKAGLRSQDVIAEIDGQSAYDLSVTEAVNRIRGEKGTSVKLTVIRGNSEQLDFTIVRDNIVIASVESKIDNGIGYLKVTRFADDTARLSREAASSFKAAGVRGVILDVRGNPGGLLESSIDLSSLWLNNKTVLEEKRDGTVVRTYKSRGTATLAGLPTVVLIDEGSASASEIVAGALKDNGAASLLGTKSYGKGSVQELSHLNGGGVLKVTIARWFTPLGRNIDKEGIEPDQKVERTDEDYANNRDPQKDAATQLLNQ